MVRMPCRESLFLWVALLIQGLLFITITPLWEGFDEPFHYAYIQGLAESGELPVFTKSMLSREVARSFEITPLSEALNINLGGGYLTFDAWWRLPESVRRERAQSLRALKSEMEANAGMNSTVSNYEAHQAPLYYLIAVPIYRLTAPLTLTGRVFCLRLFTLLIGSLTLFVLAAAARKTVPDGTGRRTALFMAALMPMFVVTAARISNDALAILLSSLTIWLVLDYFATGSTLRQAFLIGGVLGLGLLTKAYLLAVLAAIMAVFLWATVVSADRRRMLRHLAAIVLTAAVMSGWWYARNYLLYGNVSGMQELTRTAGLSVADRLRQLGAVPWLDSMRIMIRQHIWVGNNSFMNLSGGLYELGYLLIGIAALGLGIGFLRLRGRSTARAFPRVPPEAARDSMGSQPADPRGIPIAAIFYATFLLATAYHMWQSFLFIRIPGGTLGYYLYAAILPELILLAYGLLSFPGRWTGRILSVAVVTYAATINLVAFFCKMIPYYSGFAVSRFHLQHLLTLYSPTTFGRILHRLALLQAEWIGPGTIFFIAMLHLLSVTLAVWWFWRPGSSRAAPEKPAHPPDL